MTLSERLSERLIETTADVRADDAKPAAIFVDVP